ncbi:MAG: hypothetical protein ABDH21_01780 [bacterium]
MPYQLYVLKSCISTQDEVKKRIEISQNDLIAVLSETQTKGRGTYSRQWLSDVGGLYLSLSHPIIDHFLPPSTIFSLIVIKTLYESTSNSYLARLPVGIIYPNDIVLVYKQNYYKLGGILVENYKNILIVGIGLNINNRVKEYNFEHKAISIKEYYEITENISPDIEVEELSNRILTNVEIFYQNKPTSYDHLLELIKYVDFTPNLKNISVIYQSDERETVENFQTIEVNFFSRQIKLNKNNSTLLIQFERVRRIMY